MFLAGWRRSAVSEDARPQDGAGSILAWNDPARATPALLDRILALLEAKQAEVDATEAALREATARPAPLDPAALDAAALRARVADRVRHLRATVSADIYSARETVRLLLDGPARAVPVMVNGAPRYLVRGRLSTGAMHPALAMRNSDGDPNGN